MGCDRLQIKTLREHVSCELLTFKWLAEMFVVICKVGSLSDFKTLLVQWWWDRPLSYCPNCHTILSRAEREEFRNGQCYMCNPDNWPGGKVSL